MRAAQAPTPERPPRTFWFDPRFAIGIFLVFASVVGVGFLVSTADRTEQVWAATDSLTAGDVVDSGDLELRSVRLGDTAGRYLGRDALPEDGVIVTRTIAAGELVPASAVGAADSAKLASVVVGVDGQLAQSIIAGAVVDVWSAAPTDNGDYGPPAVLVSGATVVRLVESDGIIAQGDASGVEVLVPRGRIASVLEALANGHSVSLVPMSTPLAGAAGR